MADNTVVFEAKFQPGDTVYIVSYIATDIKAREVISLTIYRNRLHYVLKHPSRRIDELIPSDKVYSFADAKAELIRYCQEELTKARSIVEPSHA